MTGNLGLHLRTHHPARHPKARIDALTDGIFAVAMTLLVLDLRLPEDFNPKSAPELTAALLALWPRFVPYLSSFLVLGVRWLAGVGDREDAGPVSPAYARWWLLYLLLTTCIPFSTMVLGRYIAFAPAVWLYAINTLLLAVISYRMLVIMPDTHSAPRLLERKATTAALGIASLAAMGWSTVSAPHAMYSFLLILAGPLIARGMRQRGMEKAPE